MPPRKASIKEMPIKEYLDELRKAHETHNYRRIIVEGEGDKRFFEYLRNSILDEEYNEDLEKLHIDKVDNLCDFIIPINGNKAKVIRVLELVQGRTFETRIVGFVDREYEDFEFIDNRIIDKASCHKQDGRVFYSRGHSIENYVNSREVLSAYKTIIPHQLNFNALRIMENSYECLLQNACLLSLCGRELNCLELIRNSTLDLEIFDLVEGNLFVNFDSWKKILQERSTKINIEELNNVLSQKRSMIENTDLDVLRWFSDGHITDKLFTKAFLVIMKELCKQRKVQDEIHNKLNEFEVMNQKLNVWIKTNEAKSLENNPQIVFKFIGVWLI